MEGLDIRYSDEGDDKVKEDCCPGKPFTTFREEVTKLSPGMEMFTVETIIGHLKLNPSNL